MSESQFKRLFTLGFLVDRKANRVLLIQKNHSPVGVNMMDLAGKFNGIGGKVEPTESPIAAHKREFLEETGLNSDELGIKWHCFGRMQGESWLCLLYVAEHPEAIGKARSTTDEKVYIVDLHTLPPQTVPNMPALLSAALLSLNDPKVRVRFDYDE